MRRQNSSVIATKLMESSVFSTIQSLYCNQLPEEAQTGSSRRLRQNPVHQLYALVHLINARKPDNY
jgi:hypothetical protein